MRFAISPAQLFDGENRLENHSLIIEQGKVQQVLPTTELPSKLPRQKPAGHILCPGFIDTQVNGAQNLLFNNQIDASAIRTIGNFHRRFGSTGFLPTLISPSREQIQQGLMAFQQASREGASACLGIHIEGPFLNKNKRGVHPEKQILSFQPGDLDLFPEQATQHKILLTLAPEVVASTDIATLVKKGLIVSLGHSNADYATSRQALAAGASGFTHLYNAMSPLTSREPGMVGAALEDPESWCAIIVDGQHVHPASLKIALSAKPRGKVMLVTDAVHACGSQTEQLNLLGETIIQREGKVCTLQGTLAGSNLTMIEAVKNTVELLQLSLEEALRMASLYPAQFLGLDHQLGRIAPGYQANLIALDQHFNVTDSWIQGQHLAH